MVYKIGFSKTSKIPQIIKGSSIKGIEAYCCKNGIYLFSCTYKTKSKTMEVINNLTKDNFYVFSDLTSLKKIPMCLTYDLLIDTQNKKYLTDKTCYSVSPTENFILTPKKWKTKASAEKNIKALGIFSEYKKSEKYLIIPKYSISILNPSEELLSILNRLNVENFLCDINPFGFGFNASPKKISKKSIPSNEEHWNIKEKSKTLILFKELETEKTRAKKCFANEVEALIYGLSLLAQKNTNCQNLRIIEPSSEDINIYINEANSTYLTDSEADYVFSGKLPAFFVEEYLKKNKFELCEKRPNETKEIFDAEKILKESISEIFLNNEEKTEKSEASITVLKPTTVNKGTDLYRLIVDKKEKKFVITKNKWVLSHLKSVNIDLEVSKNKMIVGKTFDTQEECFSYQKLYFKNLKNVSNCNKAQLNVNGAQCFFKNLKTPNPDFENIGEITNIEFQVVKQINPSIELIPNPNSGKIPTKKPDDSLLIKGWNLNAKSIPKKVSSKKTPENITCILQKGIYKELKNSVSKNECFAFTDGSAQARGIGCGIFLSNYNSDYVLSAYNLKLKNLSSTDAEIFAALFAIKKAVELSKEKIYICHDFIGVATFFNNPSSAKAKEYSDFYNELAKKIKIEFVKVKAHSDVELNIIADKLAGNFGNKTKFNAITKSIA